jgi:outer membrane protein TolC
LGKSIDFPTALKEALEGNPELKAKKMEIQLGEAQLKEAKGYNWGKLQLGETFSRTNDPLYVFGMKLESREATFKDFGFADFLANMPGLMSGQVSGDQVLAIQPNDLNNPDPRNNWKTNIIYEFPIFTGFKLKYAEEMAKLQLKAKKFKFADDKEKLAVEVLKAYNGAVAAKEFVKALQKAKETTSAFVKTIKAFYGEGMATQIDLLSAQKRDNEVEAMLIEAQNKYQLALAYLRFLTDDPKITDVGGFYYEKVPNLPLSQLQKLALQNRKDLHWMAKNVETMKNYRKMEESAYYPTVGFHGEYGWNDNKFTLSKDRDYYLVAVGLKWNLVDLARSGKVEQAKVKALQTAQYYTAMRKGILVDVEKKYLDYKTKAAVIKTKEVNRELAHKILEKYTYMYKQGMVSFPILLLKEAEARKADAELIKAEYDKAVAAAELKRAIGTILERQNLE